MPPTDRNLVPDLDAPASRGCLDQVNLVEIKQRGGCCRMTVRASLNTRLEMREHHDPETDGGGHGGEHSRQGTPEITTALALSLRFRH